MPRWAMRPRSSSACSRFKRGLIGIVKSSLTGSIIGNLLLGLGLSMFVGRAQGQDADVRAARGADQRRAAVLAAFGLIVPAIYGITPGGGGESGAAIISSEIAVILFLVYLASLVFTLVTHKAVVGKAGVKAEKKEAGEPAAEVDEPEVHWSRNKALVDSGRGHGCARVHERDPHRRG